GGVDRPELHPPAPSPAVEHHRGARGDGLTARESAGAPSGPSGDGAIYWYEQSPFLSRSPAQAASKDDRQHSTEARSGWRDCPAPPRPPPPGPGCRRAPRAGELVSRN